MDTLNIFDSIIKTRAELSTIRHLNLTSIRIFLIAYIRAGSGLWPITIFSRNLNKILIPVNTITALGTNLAVSDLKKYFISSSTP